MSSDPSSDRIEPADDSARMADDIFAAAGVDATTPRARRARRKRPAPPPVDTPASPAPDFTETLDPEDRLREHASELLAATRERIVERPLQAVLIAAAAGAFAALLLGAGRR